MMNQPERLKLRHLFAFAVGNFGWSLALYGVNNLLNYFYMPNVVEGQSMFPAFIFKGHILFHMTLLGVLIAGGRLLDAVTDPLIAGFSDRFSSRWGKRQVFMAAGALPLAVTSWLAFLPPFSGAVQGNAVYLAVILVVFYISFTVYVTPCSALVSELGHTSKERLNLSTFSSLGWAMGYAFGNFIYLGQTTFENLGLGPAGAFQATMGIFGFTALIALYIPVLFIDERRFSKNVISERSSLEAMGSAVKNPNFRFFLMSELTYWFALTFIQSGIGYYVVTLMDLPKEFATYLMTLLFVISFTFYIPLNFLARRIGKKYTEVIGFIIFFMVYMIVFFLGNLPIPIAVQAGMIAVLAGIPMSIFGIIPFAIIGDLAEEEGLRTGNYNAGIYYALRGLFMKIGSSLAGLIFPSVLLWGAEDVSEWGIRMTSVFGLIFCALGFLFILMYNEKGVRATLKKHEEAARRDPAGP